MFRADNLYLTIVINSGSLTLLEPSGPVQACNGIIYLYQCTYNLILWSVRITVVAMEKQHVCVCVFCHSFPICNGPFYDVICGLSGCTVFFHVISNSTISIQVLLNTQFVCFDSVYNFYLKYFSILEEFSEILS